MDAVQRHVSTPWCLDDRLYLESRQCVVDNPGASAGDWVPAEAPICAAQHQPWDASENQCPPGMDQLRPGSAAHAPLCVRLHDVVDGWPMGASTCARLGTERSVLRLDVDEMRLVREYLRGILRGSEVFLPAEWIEPHRLRWQLAGQMGGLVEELSEQAVGQVARPGNGCAVMRVPEAEEVEENEVVTEGLGENVIM